MLKYLLVWASNHHVMLIVMIGFSLWICAYVWYAKVDIDRFLRQRRSRRWSADMVTKTGKGGYGPK